MFGANQHGLQFIYVGKVREISLEGGQAVNGYLLFLLVALRLSVMRTYVLSAVDPSSDAVLLRIGITSPLQLPGVQSSP